jgi:uncharacterized membrane protein YgcG
MAALDPAAIAKYTGIFQQACQQHGVASLDKASAGLSKSGLPVDTLLKIWALVDLDGDDRLILPEYLMCCALIKYCVQSQQPPPVVLPADLRAAAFGGGASVPTPSTGVGTGVGMGMPAPTTNPGLTTLVEMGFAAEYAEKALSQCGGDVHRAASMLMDGAHHSVPAPAPAPAPAAPAFGDAFAGFGGAPASMSTAPPSTSSTGFGSHSDGSAGGGFGGGGDFGGGGAGFGAAFGGAPDPSPTPPATQPAPAVAGGFGGGVGDGFGGGGVEAGGYGGGFGGGGAGFSGGFGAASAPAVPATATSSQAMGFDSACLSYGSAQGGAPQPQPQPSAPDFGGGGTGGGFGGGSFCSFGGGAAGFGGGADAAGFGGSFGGASAVPPSIQAPDSFQSTGFQSPTPPPQGFLSPSLDAKLGSATPLQAGAVLGGFSSEAGAEFNTPLFTNSSCADSLRPPATNSTSLESPADLNFTPSSFPPQYAAPDLRVAAVTTATATTPSLAAAAPATPAETPLSFPDWPSWLPPPLPSEMRRADALFGLLGGAPSVPGSVPHSVPGSVLAKLCAEMGALVASPNGTLSRVGFASVLQSLLLLAHEGRAVAGEGVVAGVEAPPIPIALGAALSRAQAAALAEVRATQASAHASARHGAFDGAFAPAKAAAEAEAAATAKAAAMAKAAAEAEAAEMHAKLAAATLTKSAGASVFMGAVAAAQGQGSGGVAGTFAAQLLTAGAFAGAAAAGGVDPAATPAVAPADTPAAAPAPGSIPQPTDQHKQRYSQIFSVLHTTRTAKGVSQEKAFSVLQKSGLGVPELRQVWALSDVDGDGMLDLQVRDDV